MHDAAQRNTSLTPVRCLATCVFTTLPSSSVSRAMNALSYVWSSLSSYVTIGVSAVVIGVSDEQAINRILWRDGVAIDHQEMCEFPAIKQLGLQEHVDDLITRTVNRSNLVGEIEMHALFWEHPAPADQT
jgi:hypothetical protein